MTPPRVERVDIWSLISSLRSLSLAKIFISSRDLAFSPNGHMASVEREIYFITTLLFLISNTFLHGKNLRGICGRHVTRTADGSGDLLFSVCTFLADWFCYIPLPTTTTTSQADARRIFCCTRVTRSATASWPAGRTSRLRTRCTHSALGLVALGWQCPAQRVSKPTSRSQATVRLTKVTANCQRS